VGEPELDAQAVTEPEATAPEATAPEAAAPEPAPAAEPVVGDPA